MNWQVTIIEEISFSMLFLKSSFSEFGNSFA